MNIAPVHKIFSLTYINARRAYANTVRKRGISAKSVIGSLLPLIAFALLALPAGAQNASSGSQLKLKTVVIDAGHGGKDAGAISRDRKTYEKNLTLAIATKFGKKIEEAYPDVKVIYTRTTDKFVELNERAAIANRNKADLFISVHINSNNSTSPSGFSSHILGQSSQANRDLFSANLELSKRENSVIMLEEDYDTKYQGYDPKDPESTIFFNLMQNAYYEQSILFAADVNSAMDGGPIKKNRGISQNPFLVLWKTTMPAVLLELGFISNADDLKVIASSTGQDQIATRLFNAFKTFKAEYDGSLDYTGSGSSDTTSGSSGSSGSSVSGTSASGSSSSSGTVSSAGGVRYGIQIMTLSRRLDPSDKALKGYVAEIFPTGSVFRYVVEVGDSEAGARAKLSAVRKNFSDAYLVKIENGIPTRL